MTAPADRVQPAELIQPIPEPPTGDDPLYTGPYGVPCDHREYCVLAVLDCMAARSGEQCERSPYVSPAWRAHAEGLIAFYGEDFWRKELASYIVSMRSKK